MSNQPMDKDLAAMLARVEADAELNKPTPLVDAAFDIINNESLSYIEKDKQITLIEAKASGHELTLFAEVWESLHVSTPLEEITAADAKPVNRDQE
ncbi:hypothetical protein [Shewanella sp.]|uniref:hypothetical protein n=1 Tax=Shewanella sp. TaxID=50422 RepID=UPI001ECECA1A|nr:hypothetical protein [Shewanella sp.]NRB24894.1 hypothetical protein [Shewanella sp.]